jgi:hypothetical protein
MLAAYIRNRGVLDETFPENGDFLLRHEMTAGFHGGAFLRSLHIKKRAVFIEESKWDWRYSSELRNREGRRNPENW